MQLQNEENPEETTVVISGRINTHEEPKNSKINTIQKSLDKLDVQLNQQQIYNIFKEIGYELENCFTSIKRVCYNNTGRSYPNSLIIISVKITNKITVNPKIVCVRCRMYWGNIVG